MPAVPHTFHDNVDENASGVQLNENFAALEALIKQLQVSVGGGFYDVRHARVVAEQAIAGTSFADPGTPVKLTLTAPKALTNPLLLVAARTEIKKLAGAGGDFGEAIVIVNGNPPYDFGGKEASAQWRTGPIGSGVAAIVDEVLWTSPSARNGWVGEISGSGDYADHYGANPSQLVGGLIPVPLAALGEGGTVDVSLQFRKETAGGTFATQHNELWALLAGS